MFSLHEVDAEIPIGYELNRAPVFSPSFPAKTWVASLIDSSMAPLETACANTITFTAQATDPDPDQTVTISYIPYIPFGASLSAYVTPSPAGQTASARFQWQTTCPSDIDSYIFCLRATDSNDLAYGRLRSVLCVVVVITQRAITVSTIHPATAPTLGNTTVTVFGAFLGNLIQNDRVLTYVSNALSGSQISDSSCGATVWISMTSVACLTPPGDGPSLMIHHTSEDNFGVKTDSFLTRSFTYMSPTVLSVRPLEATLFGNITITVEGYNFGVGTSIEGSFGSTKCLGNTYVSHTRFLCNVAPGLGANVPVRLTVSRLSSGALTNSFTYSPPRLLFLDPNKNINTKSGDRISMYGIGFGISDSSPTTSSGASKNPFMFWISISRVEFRAAAGVGAQILTSVTVDSQVGYSSNSFDYRPPQISSVPGSRLASGTFALPPTTGSVFAVAEGSFFGYFSPTARVRTGTTASRLVQWISDSSLTARFSPGSRSKVAVVASIACVCSAPECITQTGNYSSGIGQTGFNFTDYSSPSGTGTVYPFMPTSAACAITVIGRNMGSAFGSDKVSVAGTAALMSVWSSISSINARLGAGSAPANIVRLSVDSLSSSATQITVVISFSAPRLTSITLMNSPRSASLMATFSGTQFSLSAPSLGARIMKSATSFSYWVSDSSLFSKSVQAAFRSAFSLISVAFQISSVSSAVSYDVPLVNISRSIFTNMFAVASTGSTMVSVHLSSASLSGASPAARFISSSAASTLWVGDSTCIAKYTAMSRKNIESVQASVGVYAAVSNFFLESFIYLEQQRLVVATTGLQIITIVGTRFGQTQYSSAARAHVSACQSSLWVSDSSIRCRGAAGAVVLVGGFVSVAKVASPSVSSVFSYSVHAVTSALVPPAQGGGSSSGAIVASGGVVVAVLGSGYSSVGLSQIARLRGSGCAMSVWLSDSGLQCRSAWGKDLNSYSKQVVVSVMQRWSAMTNAISYVNVALSVASADRVPTTGGRVVSMSGQHFGSFGVSGRLQLQGTAFETSRWVSSTILLGKCAHGYGLLHGLAVSVALYSVNKPAIINRESPLPNALKPTTGPGRGGLIVTLFGTNFGSALVATPSKMEVRLGGSVCTPSLAWTSDSAVTFRHPAGILPGLTVNIITESLLSGDLANAFGFSKPILTGISPARQPTSGQSDVTFYGISFGGDPHDLARLKIGSSPCFLTTWLSDSSARCRTPPGVSNLLTATYSIGNYLTVVTRSFSYFNPVVGSIRPSYGNTAGGNSVTVTGSNFGYGAPHVTRAFHSFHALLL
jgi:hypothetical protein